MSSSGGHTGKYPAVSRRGGGGGLGNAQVPRSHPKVMPDTQAARGCPLAGVGSRQLVLL